MPWPPVMEIDGVKFITIKEAVALAQKHVKVTMTEITVRKWGLKHGISRQFGGKGGRVYLERNAFLRLVKGEYHAKNKA